MRTVRRLFHADIVWSVAFVAAAFLSLMFFIDVAEGLGSRGNPTALRAFVSGVLEAPGNLYELAPIAVLIGAIYALSRLAQSSEYTILRTGGLGPGRALQLLGVLGLLFGLATFVVGDFIAPFSEQTLDRLRFDDGGDYSPDRGGVWLKDRQVHADGERSFAVRIGRARPDGALQDVVIFEFGANGQLLQRVAAAEARVAPDATWTLSTVRVSSWPADGSAQAASTPTVGEQAEPQRTWPSGLSPQVIAAALLPSSTMSTLELRRYIDHLAMNEQAAQQQEIQFWKRALYPFACVVMMALALPFAYLRAREGGIHLKVFGGIVLGISFVLLNNVAAHLGVLRGWTPWMVAAAPSVFYLLLSLAAFGWLVRFR